MPFIRLRRALARASLGAVAFCSCITTANAEGPGDLLVAPTRLELNGFRGTEVVLNNIGSETATYRVSVELRRMTAEGELVDVDPTQANDAEKLAEEMIAYAPRRVTLAPNQPQSIRIGVRPPPNLPDGEYRVHLLFRAIPDPKPVTAAQSPTEALAIELTAIYGVTIPVIVRAGQLSAQAGIAGAKLTVEDGKPAVAVELTRTGNRSLYGDVQVLKPGSSNPIVVVTGVAIYAELDRRSVVLTVPDGFKGSLAGPATIRYVERTDEGPGKLLAEAQVMLR
jgi:P pilus assembly chaperone PapD